MRWLGRRGLVAALAILVAAATVSVVVTAAPVPGRGPTRAGAASVCTPDGASGCLVTLPCASQPCPSVDVAPVVGLSDGQYPFIRAKNFPAGDSMRIAVCSGNSSAADPSCLLGPWEEKYWTPIHVPITVDAANQNLTQVSYPVFYDQAGQGNSALPAHDLLNTKGTVPGFFCGDAADPCVLEVTEEVGTGNDVGNGPAPDPTNTAVIPLSFDAQSAGCPKSDPTLYTDSSFSLEHFMPTAVEATCAGKGGVVALNTATDNHTVISDFATGGSTLGFVDDPADPAQEASLKGKSFAYIPVALSATSVSFLAGVSFNNLGYPLSVYNLTPNMVAGLITSEYESPQGSVQGGFKPGIVGADNIASVLNCNKLLGCKAKTPTQELENELPYDAFDLLNPISKKVVAPNSFGSYMSNVPNGGSYQITDWICRAPNTPYTVHVKLKKPPVGEKNPVAVTVTDPNVASTTLTTAPNSSSIWPPPNNPPWVFPSCTQPYATLPALAGVNPQYGESSSPAFQAKAIRNFSFGGGVLPDATTPLAAFGVMDSSEAAFYGLSDANLQNPAGQFVAPTAASLTAAAAGVTPCGGSASCPAGTYSVNYASNANASAYPLPDITYAIVPTTPQPAATATAIKSLLTNLVTYSHGDGQHALPAGYAPLPTALYQAALADINADVVAASAPTTGAGGKRAAAGSSGGKGTTGQGGLSGQGSSANGSNGSSSDTSPGSTSGSSSLPATRSGRTGGHGGSGSDSGGNARRTVPTGLVLVTLSDLSRFLLPALIVFGIACLIAGPVLLYLQARRRKRLEAEVAP
jgi:hypothetical protein